MSDGSTNTSCGTISINDDTSRDDQTYTIDCDGAEGDSVTVQIDGEGTLYINEIFIQGAGMIHIAYTLYGVSQNILYKFLP